MKRVLSVWTTPANLIQTFPVCPLDSTYTNKTGPENIRLITTDKIWMWIHNGFIHNISTGEADTGGQNTQTNTRSQKYIDEQNKQEVAGTNDKNTS